MERHLEYITKESEEARKSIACQLGVEYGYSENEKVDIFGTDLPDDTPIVIFVHGGRWQALSRNATSYTAKGLRKEGFKVMVVGYNLCPYVTMDKIAEEIGSAVKFCLTYAKEIGCRSVAIGGHSAGAHLVATTFISAFVKMRTEYQQLVKTVFLLAGVYDLTHIVNSPANESLKLTEEVAKNLSPMQNPIKSKNRDIKFNLYIGKDDTEFFYAQTKEYREKLTKWGYCADLHVLAGRDHCSIAFGLMEDDYIVIRNLKKVLK